jgi:hypothetical protein
MGLDCSEVTVLAKVIATDADEEITNRIVKGTNRQNIVYDEAFEVTRDFHKELEAFFGAMAQDKMGTQLFYERRSKQFAGMQSIKISQKVNFTVLIQSFISVFLNQPYLGHRHPSFLLHQYRNKIFADEQSKYPYYVAALLFSRIEERVKNLGASIKPYKAHIALIFKLMTCQQSPNINNEALIDEYCKKLHTMIASKTRFDAGCDSAIDKFQTLVSEWVHLKGQSFKYGVKDSIEFTSFILSKLTDDEKGSSHDQVKFRGCVEKIGVDRNGQYFGFISKTPDNVFFHSSDNPSINMQKILYKTVLYDIITDKFSGKQKALNIELIE